MYNRLSSTAHAKLFQQHPGLLALFCEATPNRVNARRLTQNLPRLPVPALKQTLDKFLRTVRPHVNDREFAVTSELVKKLCAENGAGVKLQKFLVERAETTENWLADWWLHAAYLDFRHPVVVYSSPGLVFPFENFRTEWERSVYAARLILAAVEYKRRIDNDEIPLETMGKDPLDMSQYKKVFGTCRVPGLKRDTLEYHPASTHIVVAHGNRFFKLELYGEDKKVIGENQLVALLQDVLERSVGPADPVGILTTQHRDTWGQVYQHLVKNPDNEKSLAEIRRSLFLVCLDGPMPVYKEENRQTTASRQFIHGGGSAGNAGNRWYDKTIQFIIGQDGTVGLTYEHSPSEGQPIAVMTDFIVDYIHSNASGPDAAYDGVPQELPLSADGATKSAIEAASAHVDGLDEDLDVRAFTFTSFGKDFIKSRRLSPDSFLQIAMQYAFYRIHGTPGAHYESAATRKYVHGRTETIRSCSVESVAFARAMLDPKRADGEKVGLLRQAVDGHKTYTVEALNGYGVDRHLLGLKLMAMERKAEIPELYTDIGYIRSAHMRISTSQVATKCDGFMCYGPLVEDGYACCYNPRDKDINFAVSAFAHHPETEAANFSRALEDSLLDMHNLLVKTQKSKL